MISKQEACYRYIRDRILSGEWSPGHKLPSQSTWAAEYGWKYGPMRSAYLMLKAEGLIQGQQGDGVFVREHKYWLVSE